MRLFPFPRIVDDPVVIAPVVRSINDDVSWDSKQLKGRHYLVFPSNAYEVFAIQSLEHRVQKFAPYKEGGVLLTAEAYKGFAGKEES